MSLVNMSLERQPYLIEPNIDNLCYGCVFRGTCGINTNYCVKTKTIGIANFRLINARYTIVVSQRTRTEEDNIPFLIVEVLVNRQRFTILTFTDEVCTTDLVDSVRAKRFGTDNYSEETIEYCMMLEMKLWKAMDSIGVKWHTHDPPLRLPNHSPSEEATIESRAKQLLKNPNLLNKIVREYNRYHSGDQKLLAFLYVICTARYISGEWQHISGKSRGGKDDAVRVVLQPFPKGDTMIALRFTEHGIEYTGKKGQPVILDGKIIYVSEYKGLQYALETLRPIYGQKGKQFTTYSVGVDRKGQEILIIGCPVLINTSVIPRMTDQTIKRFWLTSIDESEQQTKRAQRLQKYIDSHPSEYGEKTEMMKVMEKAVTLYPKDAIVFVPYTEFIEFPSDRVRHRGDLRKFLNFVKCVACTHMFQRCRLKIGNKIIVIAEKTDFDIAKTLLENIFVASLFDLPNYIQNFYQRIRPVLEAVGQREGGEVLYPDGLKVKDIVRHTTLSDPTVRAYMERLVDAGFAAKEERGRANHYFPATMVIPNAQRMAELVKVDWEAHEEPIQRRIDEEIFAYQQKTSDRIVYVERDGTERICL